MALPKKKKSIKRNIDLEVVKSLDRKLKDKLLEYYTDILIEQEAINRAKQIAHAKNVFVVKQTLVKDLGDNDTEREEMLALVSSFPTKLPTTEKGWSRVLGIIERKGNKKTKRNVEFPIAKSRPAKSKKKATPKAKAKSSTKKK